jgi:hypothetical protein
MANLIAHGAYRARFGAARAENESCYSAHLALKLSQPQGYSTISRSEPKE